MKLASGADQRSFSSDSDTGADASASGYCV
jgi:hypothetical protein